MKMRAMIVMNERSIEMIEPNAGNKMNKQTLNSFACLVIYTSIDHRNGVVGFIPVAKFRVGFSRRRYQCLELRQLASLLTFSMYAR